MTRRFEIKTTYTCDRCGYTVDNLLTDRAALPESVQTPDNWTVAVFRHLPFILCPACTAEWDKWMNPFAPTSGGVA